CGGQGDVADVKRQAPELHAQSVGQVGPIPLVVVLWDDIYFGGNKRQFVQDEPYLGPGQTYSYVCNEINPASGKPTLCGWSGNCLAGPDFNDRASAIGVHPGPDYQAYIAQNGQEPTVTLYTDADYHGPSLTLRAGTYSNLVSLGFNDVISSIRFNDN